MGGRWPGRAPMGLGAYSIQRSAMKRGCGAIPGFSCFCVMLYYGCYEKQLEPSDLVSSRNGKWRTCNRQRPQGAAHVEYHSTPNRTSFFKGTLRFELAPKRLELIREGCPGPPSWPLLINPTNPALMETTTKEAQACAPDGRGQWLANVWRMLVHPTHGSVYRTLPSFRSYNISS